MKIIELYNFRWRCDRLHHVGFNFIDEKIELNERSNGEKTNPTVLTPAIAACLPVVTWIKYKHMYIGSKLRRRSWWWPHFWSEHYRRFCINRAVTVRHCRDRRKHHIGWLKRQRVEIWLWCNGLALTTECRTPSWLYATCIALRDTDGRQREAGTSHITMCRHAVCVRVLVAIRRLCNYCFLALWNGDAVVVVRRKPKQHE